MAWGSLLDSIYQAQAAIAGIDRTEVHLFGDDTARKALARLALKDPSIVVRLRDGRPDTSQTAKTRNGASATKRPTPAEPQAAITTPTSTPQRSAPVPQPPTRASNPAPPIPTATVVHATRPGYGVTVKESFTRFGVMVGVSAPVWFLTPVVASFSTLMIPNMSGAVFAASENGGRTAGDGPNTLYAHLAFVLAFTCVLILLLNLSLGIADDKFTWLPVVFTIAGIVGFFWLVIARGGALWMWDLTPAAGVVGYLLAQLITRIQRA